MGNSQIKIPAKKISFILAALLSSLVFAGQTYAALPYFKVYGGDAATGGWFNSGQTSCTNSAFFQASGTPAKGGVMAFVKSAFNPLSPDYVNNGGASSQLAAISLGPISYASGGSGQYGFFAGGDGGNRLSFANTGSSPNYSGAFESLSYTPTQHQYGHCIPDYYGVRGTDTASFSTNPGSLSGLSNGKYLSDLGGSVQTINASAINPPRNVTLFVNGDTYINGPITYGGSYNDTNVPKLAVVVKGNIYIDPSVTRLDGFYVAQPDSLGAGV